MADSSTTTYMILDLTAGYYWVQRQLPRRGIMYAYLTLILIRPLTLVRVVFTLFPIAISELHSIFLHSHGSDPEYDCGRLLGSTPATRWYRESLCRINTHEIADSL